MMFLKMTSWLSMKPPSHSKNESTMHNVLVHTRSHSGYILKIRKLFLLQVKLIFFKKIDILFGDFGLHVYSILISILLLD